jgi:Domain of unknown function (DUF4911)
MMSEPNHQPHQKTIRFAIEPAKIALFKAIVESYDNLATLRTDDPKQHHLMLYFADDMEAEVLALVDSLRKPFSIRELPGQEC